MRRIVSKLTVGRQKAAALSNKLFRTAFFHVDMSLTQRKSGQRVNTIFSLATDEFCFLQIILIAKKHNVKSFRSGAYVYSAQPKPSASFRQHNWLNGWPGFCSHVFALMRFHFSAAREMALELVSTLWRMTLRRWFPNSLNNIDAITIRRQIVSCVAMQIYSNKSHSSTSTIYFMPKTIETQMRIRIRV